MCFKYRLQRCCLVISLGVQCGISDFASGSVARSIGVRDWWGGVFPEWPILCRMERKTSTGRGQELFIGGGLPSNLYYSHGCMAVKAIVCVCVGGGSNPSGDWTYGPRSGGADSVRGAGGVCGLLSSTTSPVLHGHIETKSQWTPEERTLGTGRCKRIQQDNVTWL